MTDHYQTLGVPRTASEAEVRKAFRDYSSAEHPDLLPRTASDAIRAARTARFQAVSAAYAVLSDPEKRAAYDRDGGTLDVNDLLAYGGEVAATVGALRGPNEAPADFATRMALNGAREAFRFVQTPEGKRAISGLFARLAGTPPGAGPPNTSGA